MLEAAAGAIRAGLNELPGPPSLDRLRVGVRFYAAAEVLTLLAVRGDLGCR